MTSSLTSFAFQISRNQLNPELGTLLLPEFGEYGYYTEHLYPLSFTNSLVTHPRRRTPPLAALLERYDEWRQPSATDHQ
jgi:hypothetical protein